MLDETNNLCQICGEGKSTSRTWMVLHKYKGRSAMLPLRYIECDTCKSESAGEEESKANKAEVMMFHRQVDDSLGNQIV